MTESHRQYPWLSALLLELIAHGFATGDLTYRQLNTAAVNGRLPAVWLVGRRWVYDPQRIPEIARALGLVRTDPQFVAEPVAA